MGNLDKLVAALRPIPRERIDAQTLVHLRKVERAGACHVSVYELPNGITFIVAHQTPEPSRDVLVRALESYVANNSKPEGTA